MGQQLCQAFSFIDCGPASLIIFLKVLRNMVFAAPQADPAIQATDSDRNPDPSNSFFTSSVHLTSVVSDPFISTYISAQS